LKCRVMLSAYCGGGSRWGCGLGRISSVYTTFFEGLEASKMKPSGNLTVVVVVVGVVVVVVVVVGVVVWWNRALAGR
jgi:hypothetical protein